MSIIRKQIDWQGITLSVFYQPHWHGAAIHHLEIEVLEPAGAILPVTDTGYRSHFFSAWIETEADLDYYVVAWLNHAADAPQWKRQQERAKQLTLF